MIKMNTVHLIFNSVLGFAGEQEVDDWHRSMSNNGMVAECPKHACKLLKQYMLLMHEETSQVAQKEIRVNISWNY